MKDFKTKMFIAALLLLCCVCVVALVACNNRSQPSASNQPQPTPDNPSNVTHEHNFVPEKEIPATCTTDGSKVYKCECGETRSESIEKLGHDLDWASDSNNLHWRQCTRCDFATEKLPHDYSELVSIEVEPTCTQQGVKVMRCECGTETKETIEKTQHSFTLANRDQTHHWTECSVCHEIDATTRAEHTFDEQISLTPSTCTQQGEKVSKCECGELFTEKLSLAQHDYTAYDFDEAEHWRVCANCNEEQSGTRVSHAMQEQSVVSPNCTDDGLESRTCVCGKQEKVVLSALGHDFDKTAIYNQGTWDSGHVYKCTRCDELTYESHIAEPCDCPGGNAKAATCGQSGHADEQCSVCQFLHEYNTDPTGEHTWSDDYKTNDEQHWHYCTVCDTPQEKLPHTETTEDFIEPTCQSQGYQRTLCEECGKVLREQILPKTAHNFEYDEASRVPATCTTPGSVTKRCTFCTETVDEEIKKLPHSYGKLQFDGSGHWKTCESCGKEDRAVHSYHIVEGSEVPSTCTKHGSYRQECSVCSYSVVVEAELAPHKLEYYPAQDRTETEDGWRNHWKCTVCGKYFSSKQGGELTEDQVFDRNPRAIEVQSVQQLMDEATKFTDEQSTDYYQVTATIWGIDVSDGLLMLGAQDDELLFWAYFEQIGEFPQLHDGDEIIVKGFLRMESDDVYMYQCVLLEVLPSDPEIVSMSVRVQVTAGKPTLYAESETGEYFFIVNYGEVQQQHFSKQLLIGEKLTFYFEDYGDKNDVKSVVKKFVINNESYTMTNGVFEMEVMGAIEAELEFAQYANNNVPITAIETTHNNVVKYNPYLSYCYVGTANEYLNRLYAGSHLRFTLANAYITRVEIEFEDYNSDKLAQNTVAVGTDEVHKTQIANTFSNLKAVFTFDKANKYTFFEYNAVSQARIKSITIQYETYNT